MPQHRLEYRILLSSPSDLIEERKAAAEIVAEVSNCWGSTVGAILRLLSWETGVSPAFAKEPQEVINKGLGDTWDIYLGLMHTRFGTPTQQFGSGTEEEFERAYALWATEKDRRELMFYFKTGDVDLNTIDTEQLSKVRAFRSKFSGKGGFYGEFRNSDDFKALFRAHLTNTLAKLHQNLPSRDSKELVVDQTPFPYEVTEPGLLDLIEMAAQNSAEMLTSIEGIGYVMSESTDSMNTCLEEMNAAKESGSFVTIRDAVSLIAKSILSTSKNLAERRRSYSEVSRKTIETYSRSVSLTKTISAEGVDLQTFATSIYGLVEQIETFVKTLKGLERNIDSVANISKELSTANLVLRREVSLLRSEFNSTLVLLKELIEVVEE